MSGTEILITLCGVSFSVIGTVLIMVLKSFVKRLEGVECAVKELPIDRMKFDDLFTRVKSIEELKLDGMNERVEKIEYHIEWLKENR
jgi:hypothetical protein